MGYFMNDKELVARLRLCHILFNVSSERSENEETSIGGIPNHSFSFPLRTYQQF